MTDFTLKPRNAPQAKIRLDPTTDRTPMLRAYRATPEGIVVQIRWNKGYASATLSYAEAKRFAFIISEAAEELPETTKQRED